MVAILYLGKNATNNLTAIFLSVVLALLSFPNFALGSHTSLKTDQSPPQVRYTYSQYFDSTTAQFISGILTNGNGISVWFSCQFGSDIRYSLPEIYTADTGMIEVTQSISGLPVNVSYDYMVIVATSLDTIFSIHQTGNTSTAFAAPKVITLPPDSITPTSVRLRAICNSHGSIATYSFGGRFDIAFDSKWSRLTPITLIPGSNNDTLISEVLTGFIPLTKFHVYGRALAATDRVISRGEILDVTTLYDSNARGLTTPIFITSASGKMVHKVLTFGVHTYATYCMDLGLGEQPLPPPAPPPTWDVRFVDTRGGSGACFSDGMDVDLRSFYSSAQIDTYKIRTIVDPSDFPVELSWPDLDTSYSGKVRLLVSSDTVNMKSQSSYELLSSVVGDVSILAEGPNAHANRPSVILKAPGYTDSTSIHLSAAINPNGFTTAAWFAWGSSEGYGLTTPAQELARDSGVTLLSGNLDQLSTGSVYHYCVVTRNSFGTYHGPDVLLIPSRITSVSEHEQLPVIFRLYQNFPNPFNPVTTLTYSLPRETHVTLSVYNVLGQEVSRLIDDLQQPGYKSVDFVAGNLSSGIYFYRLQAGNFVDVKKMLLMR